MRARTEFEAVQTRGRRTSLAGVLALSRSHGVAPARLGITASAKVGNAVVRNTAKRWIREWFRHARAALPAGLELVLVVRKGAIERGHGALARELTAVERLLAKGGGVRT